MSKIEIIHGDVLEKLKNIPSESIDLVIADPPYNLGKDYGNRSDCKSFDEYLEFSESWLKECDRLLKPEGAIYVFMGVRFISYLYEILEQKLGYHFGSWICWHYTQGMGKIKGFSPRHDDILLFHKAKKFTFNLDTIRIPQKYYRARNNMRGANPGDVWKFSHIHYCSANRQMHPTQKPEGVAERMILASSNQGDTVLDPFSGSGTILRVCSQLKRNAVGIELNEEYVSGSVARLDGVFGGFDSIDERMKRVPLDLPNNEIRIEYLRNHKEWFLTNHENAFREFKKNVIDIYGINAFEKAFGTKHKEHEKRYNIQKSSMENTLFPLEIH